MTHDEVVLNFINSLEVKNEMYLSKEKIMRSVQWAEEQSLFLNNSSSNNRIVRRIVVQKFAESIVETYLGVNFIDWSINNTYDISSKLQSLNINCDINVCSIMPDRTSIPLTPINPSRSSIIVFIRAEGDIIKGNVCGLAKIDTLLFNSSLDLVSDAIRNEGKLTGFYGVNQLINFVDVDDLKNKVD